jgi:hypothetical protein
MNYLAIIKQILLIILLYSIIGFFKFDLFGFLQIAADFKH